MAVASHLRERPARGLRPRHRRPSPPTPRLRRLRLKKEILLFGPLFLPFPPFLSCSTPTFELVHFFGCSTSFLRALRLAQHALRARERARGVKKMGRHRRSGKPLGRPFFSVTPRFRRVFDVLHSQSGCAVLCTCFDASSALGCTYHSSRYAQRGGFTFLNLASLFCAPPLVLIYLRTPSADVGCRVSLMDRLVDLVQIKNKKSLVFRV